MELGNSFWEKFFWGVKIEELEFLSPNLPRICVEFAENLAGILLPEISQNFSLRNCLTLVLGIFGKKFFLENVPIISVACDKSILMFKKRKKYLKVDLPHRTVTNHEILLWKEYNGEAEGLNTFLMALNSLKNDGVQLGYQSLNILMLESQKDQLKFYQRSKNIQENIYDTATCMCSIRRGADEEGQPSNLVVGTEFGALLILSDNGDSIQSNVKFFCSKNFCSINSTKLQSN